MANDQLSIPERAALLALMTFVKEASNPDLRARYGFTIEKEVRQRLQDELGYITATKTGPNRSFMHELTDEGWRRCREELAEAAPKGAEKGYRVLYGVLRCLDIYLTKSGQKMSDVFLLPDAHSVTTPLEVPDVEKRIRATYEDLAARPGAWVSLARLRAVVYELPRHEVDEALLRLDIQPHVYLIAEANQKILTDADRAAAIRIGGENKHLLSIEPQ
jgi:hypothetical protein